MKIRGRDAGQDLCFSNKLENINQKHLQNNKR